MAQAGLATDQKKARRLKAQIVFIDETGNPTTELLEGGLVWVRVVGASSNLDPNQAETLTVSLQTRYAGDQETLQLTETGPDTGVFEGSIPTEFNSGTPGDGRLQMLNSGWPVSSPEEVTVVAGSTSARAPGGVRVVRALSAIEMREAVMREVADATVFIAAAAVADYRPAERAASKLKKKGEALTLTLEPTPDILEEVSRTRRDGLLVVGFAAETDSVVENARAKLERKNLDAVVANDLTQDGAGFDKDTNVITLLARDREQPTTLPLMSKLDAAHRVLDEVARLRSQTKAGSV